MLRYLLLIVFFISFRLCSYAQKEKWDSAYLQHFVDSTHTIPSDVDLSTLHLYKGTFINSSYDGIDTIRCIMLVSDSSYSSNKVVWIKGYEVFVRRGNPLWGNDSSQIFYLDVIKQPLQKSIIVWQSKEY